MAAPPQLLIPESQTGEAGRPAIHGQETLHLLARGFGAEFAIVDGISGELLRAVTSPPGNHWDVRGELCREVARHGRPEFIEEEDPFLVLAVPLGQSAAGNQVAVGTFLTRPLRHDEDFAAGAELLGLPPDEAADWAMQQVPWPPEALQRVADLLLSHLAERERGRGFEEEVQSLSVHLASTYEEISLLYRLTRNLKISKSDEDLGRVALEWLLDVLPAEGVALQLLPVVEQAPSLAPQARHRSELLTHGRCPIDNAQFTQLIEYLDAGLPNQPVVVNHPVTGSREWPYPQIRQLIAVPLAEGNNVFGWLVGLNHVEGAEFGTVEASLLSSVGAILGIHSGNIELYRQQSELLAGVVRALTSAIDAKDRYTCGHSDRVARIAVRLAQEIGCDAKTVNTIYLSGLLHDIGKIGIDDSVLRKPGKLTDEEYEHIKRHVQIGHRILLDLKKLDDLLPVVLHHHESWDGSGYPYHLPAEEIPLSARIVAVADAYDAMGSDRPYRKGMPDEKIDEIFRAGAGKQWDPTVVEAFFHARDDLREIVRREREEIQIDMQAWR
jgi:GAF domain-containing protein